MFRIQSEGVVTGRDGICYSYQGRPMIPILIKATGMVTGVKEISSWIQEQMELS